MYIPIHSDFIIHWTGADIEKKMDAKHGPKKTPQKEEERNLLYLERLESILNWGLWMTKEKKDQYITKYKYVSPNNYKIQKISRPWVARTCFTELKLSLAADHAAKFGRLGIGFKKPFLFYRLGSPMMYYHPGHQKNWFFPEHFKKRHFNKSSDFFSCFYKEMCPVKTEKRIYWKFSFFDESEWRIIFSEDVREVLKDLSEEKVIEYFRTPAEINDKSLDTYLKRIGQSPEYLIPLDAWLSMIIYPNIEVKHEAQGDHFRELIKRIKSSPDINRENNNYPIEMDLPACKNF